MIWGVEFPDILSRAGGIEFGREVAGVSVGLLALSSNCVAVSHAMSVMAACTSLDGSRRGVSARD